MEIDTDDAVLRDLADGKSMDYTQWPGMLARLLSRLEKIIQEEFPPLSKPTPPSQTLPSSPPQPPSASSSQNKENAPPSPNTATTASPPVTATTFPAPIQSLLTSITSTLTTYFTTHPPHTIQRLAELLLQPTAHYRTLPSYLHALDRVVHVTSGAQTFPLPPAIPEPSSLSVLSNGTTGTSVDPHSVSWGNPTSTALGSDESLGGALLTPITWLNRSNGHAGSGTHSPLEGEVKTESTEMVEGPNGLGGVETVSVSVNGISSITAIPASSSTESEVASLRAEGGITQGELLRQEQRAGVVPAAQLSGSRGDSDGMGEDDEMPHARGPEEIGMEDMGPQAAGGSGTERSGMGMQGIDIEAAVGRKIEVKSEEEERPVVEEKVDEDEGKEAPGTPKREADVKMGGEEKRVKSEDGKDVDVDVELVDADGRAADEPKVGEKGENKGADAVDTSSV